MMTSDGRPDPANGTPAHDSAKVEVDHVGDQPAPPSPAPGPRWRPDRDSADREGSGPRRPVAARRLRTGCWVVVVILLLLCCVLTAWLSDTILDIRTVTTGG